LYFCVISEEEIGGCGASPALENSTGVSFGGLRGPSGG